MNLQLVDRYILSLTKNEDLFSEKKRTGEKKTKKSVQRREVKRLLVFLFHPFG